VRLGPEFVRAQVVHGGPLHFGHIRTGHRFPAGPLGGEIEDMSTI
jgi:hypothetical protein